ncbi:MAG: hypothetical protein ABI472_20675 [Ginsengibacter sp.]
MISKGVLIVNPTGADHSVIIPSNADQHMLTADELETKKIQLNGETLKLKSNGTQPAISGKKIQAGEVTIPPHSILFLSFKNI